MVRVKRIKIYTHHGSYINVVSNTTKAGVKLSDKIFYGIFAAFYYSGLGVIKFFGWLKIFIVGTRNCS